MKRNLTVCSDFFPANPGPRRRTRNLIHHGPTRRDTSTIYILNRQGRVIETNETVRPLTGKPLEEIIGADFPGFLDPLSARSFQELVAAANPPDTFSMACAMKTGEGALVRTELTIITLREEMETIGFVVRAEVARPELSPLAEPSSPSYRQLLMHISEPVIELDPDFQVLYANRAAREVFGYDPSEPFEKVPLPQLAPQESIEQLKPAIYAALGDCESAAVPARFRRKDGSFFRSRALFAKASGNGSPDSLWMILKSSEDEEQQ